MRERRNKLPALERKKKSMVGQELQRDGLPGQRLMIFSLPTNHCSAKQPNNRQAIQYKKLIVAMKTVVYTCVNCINQGQL